jgi:hypothetical protein
MTSSLSYESPLGSLFLTTENDDLLSSILNPSRVFNVLHFGARGNGSTNDTSAVQAALDEAELYPGSVVMLPYGTYSVNGVVLTGHNVTLTGPGTLKLRSGSTTNACLRLASAILCRVVGVSVDGGRDDPHTGNANGIQIDSGSMYNVLQDCYVTECIGRGYEVIGSYNILTRPRSYDVRREALHINPNAKDTQIIGMMIVSTGLTEGATYGVRSVMDEGYNSFFLGGVIDQSAVSFDASLLGHAAFLHDPLPSTTLSCRMIGVTVIHGNGSHGDSGCTAVKFARCEEVFLEGLKVYCNESYASVRFAEACKRINIKGLRADTHIFKENALDTASGPEIFIAEDCHLNLNATHRSEAGFDDMRAQQIFIDRCQVHGTRFAVMDILDTDLIQAVFDGCHLQGDAESPGTNIFLQVSDQNTMLKTSGKYVYLPNNRMTTLGSGSSFIGPSPGKRQLMSTVDKTGKIFEQSAIPVDSSVNWRIGDIVRNTTTPASGVAERWVCKIAGAGGTGSQFHAINYP